MRLAGLFPSKVVLALIASLVVAGPARSAEICNDLLSSQGRLISRANEVLRGEAAAVTDAEIKSGAITETLNRMLDIYDQTGAVGIAAPQIGVSKQILMAKVRVPGVAQFDDRQNLLVMINPVLKPVGTGKTLMVEGCLSLGSTCAIVARDKKVIVEFQDIAGEKHEFRFSGYSARIIQHEVDHLHGILFTDRAPSFAELLTLAPKRTPEQRALLSDVKAIFGGLKIADRFRWRWLFSRVVDSFEDPYSFTYDLKTTVDKSGKNISSELKSLARMIAMTDRIAQAQALSDWVTSDEHALFLYELLYQRGLQNYSLAIDLLARNPHFAEAHRQRGPPFSFLGYSFEKEGQNPDIGDFYKVPGIDDADWFKKPADERLKLLKSRAIVKKTFLPASKVAPTGMKPSFLSGFSLELTNVLHPIRNWEVSHKRYELSLSKLMEEVEQLSHYFDETHSFQLHTVFELPRAYRFYANFRLWLKSLNDFLYLRGLEEGLHGNELTNMMQLPEDATFFERIKDSDSMLQTLRADDVKLQSDKMFSGGLRGQIYGVGSSIGFIKLGIELRDVTRNIKQLGRIMVTLSDSIVQRVWEAKPLKPVEGELVRLSKNRARVRELLGVRAIRPEIINRFIKAEPTVVIGLEKFEDGLSYNYKTGKFETADEKTAERIGKARASYVEALLNIQKEIDDFTAKHVEVTDEELQLAIRQSLTEWAKQARVSERYSF